MANWKYKVDLKDDWKLAEQRAITAHELAQRVATKLNGIVDTELPDIIAQFKELPADATYDDFDEVLEQLYDWGDEEVHPYGQWPPNKKCWIGTC